MNNLDTVWASLSSADRIVLLGHDRNLLTDAEKTRLASLAAAKADRRAQVTATARKPARAGQGNRGQGTRGQGTRGQVTRARRAA